MMNDFTKDELEEIAACFALTKTENDELLCKIHRLIDNYCEHNSATLVYICDECKTIESQCNDCGYVWYEDQQ